MIFNLKKRPKPTIQNDNDVLIAVKSVGICGSDVHYWVHGKIGDFVLKAPMVLGHESSGQVVEIGKNVKHLKPGDRITMEPGVPCRQCNYCKIGRYNLCRDVIFMATPPYDGSIANFITHPSDYCYKIPDHVSFEEAAMCEPLSVGVHACNRAGIKIGSVVLITGAGPIGLVCLLAAKAAGATTVILSDIKDERLEVAKKLGANLTISAKEDVKSVLDQLGHTVDFTIECSGAESAIRTALRATKSGGTVVLVGLGPNEIKLPLVDSACREVDIRGIFRYANCYPTALQLIASGKVDVKPLITHRFSLNETIKAFEKARDMEGIKIMINI